MPALDYEKILDNYASGALVTMAKARGLAVGSTGKIRNVAALLSVIADPESLRRAYAALEPGPRTLLSLLRELGGAATVGQLFGMAERTGMADVDDDLYRLMRQAVVVYDGAGPHKHELWRSQGSGYGWKPDRATPIVALPGALELVDVPVALPTKGQTLEVYTGTPARIDEQSPSGLLHNLFVLLQRAGDGKLGLTQAMIVNKTDLRRITKELGGNEIRVDFLCALAWHARLLQPKNSALRPHPDADQFFSRTPQDQIGILLEGWRTMPTWSEFTNIPEIVVQFPQIPGGSSYYYGHTDVPTAERLEAARTFILDTILNGKMRDEWYGVASLALTIKEHEAGFLVPRKKSNRDMYRSGYLDLYHGMSRAGAKTAPQLHKSSDWDVVEGGYIRAVLSGPLHWLGIVQAGFDAAGRLDAFRLTPMGMTVLGLATATATPSAPSDVDAKPLVVQPNFEIIVYTEAEHLPVLFLLERFADRISFDRVAHYRLTREGVHRGLQGGLSAADIQAFLAAHSRSALPQNVVYSLHDWQKIFDRVHVYRSTTIVQADSAAELDKALKDIPPATVVRVAPEWAIVHGAAAAAPLQQLATQDGATQLDYTMDVRHAFDIDQRLRVCVPPGHMDLWLRARLDQFCDFVKDDAKGAHFEITRASFDRAVALGLAGDEILGFVTRYGPTRLPADVDLTLRGWGGAIGAAALTDTVVLACQGDLVACMLPIEELRKLLWLIIDDRTALVRADDVPGLRAALEKRGIALGATLEERLEAPAKPRAGASPKSYHPAHRRVEETPSLVPGRAKVKTPPFVRPHDAGLMPLDMKALRQILDLAISDGQRITIDYHGKSRRAVRVIEPEAIFEDDGHCYIEAYDHLSHDYRQFRLDRILAISLE